MAFDLLKTRCWHLRKRLNTEVPQHHLHHCSQFNLPQLVESVHKKSIQEDPVPLLCSLVLPVFTPSIQEKPRKPVPLTYKEIAAKHKKTP